MEIVKKQSLDSEILPAPKRFPSVDFDEALAMFFVVLYHSRFYSTNIISGGWQELVAYWFNGFLSTCVPVFFLVNGFLLFGKDLDLKRHVFKTIRLTVVTIVWGFVIPVVAAAITGEHYSLREYLHMGWYYKVGWNNQLWFMGALVCLYLVFPLLKTAFDANRRTFLFFFLACAVLAFGNSLLNEVASLAKGLIVGSPTVVEFDFFGQFNVLRGLYGFAFVYFCLGGILREKYPWILDITPRVRILGALAILVFCSILLALWGSYATIARGGLSLILFGMVMERSSCWQIRWQFSSLAYRIGAH